MKKVLRLMVLGAAVIAVAALAAGCGSRQSSTSTTSTTSSSGGSSVVGSGSYSNGTPSTGSVYTIGWGNSVRLTNNFDPTGEYLGNAWGLFSNLMLRPLVGYKHKPGATGNELIGDLATDVPKPTNGGLTYTYKLRDGVKFGPPVNRAVTSK